MAGEQYSSLAEVYDALNTGCDYDALCSYLTKEIKENEKSKTSLLLDLACGTGKLTLMLREVGFDMTGIDLSEDMLSVAREACYEKGINDVLWLCQDMTAFELFGTVDACVCCLDSINYLTKLSDVKKCFSLVYNYLIPDGVFVFDINTPYKFEKIYGDNAYILEDEYSLVAWQNEFNRRTGICKFYLNIFTESEDGSYDRKYEVQGKMLFRRKDKKGSYRHGI